MIFDKRTEREQPKKSEVPAKTGEAEKLDDVPGHSAKDEARRAKIIEKKSDGSWFGYRTASEYTDTNVLSYRNEELKPDDSSLDPC